MANTQINDFDAAMAALKRYKANGLPAYSSEILDRSNLEMSSNISLIVVKKSYDSLKIIRKFPTIETLHPKNVEGSM